MLPLQHVVLHHFYALKINTNFNIYLKLPNIGLEPIPLVGLDFKSNVSAIPPDGPQLGRTRTTNTPL